MNEVNWYYPQNLDEIKVFLQKEDYFLYAGGTHIFKVGLQRAKGFISTDGLKLDYINFKNDWYSIGASVTFSQLLDYLKKNDPENILHKALKNSASTPLRNKITIGGSIACAPIWSDLIGPLYVLDVQVELIGKNNGFYSLEDLYNKKLIAKSLVKCIRFKKQKIKSEHIRVARTSFDYPALNISIVGEVKNNKFVELKIYLVGTKNKVSRLAKLEDKIKREKIGSLSKEFIFDNCDIEFSDKKHGSASYLKEVTCVEINRVLKRFVG